MIENYVIELFNKYSTFYNNIPYFVQKNLTEEATIRDIYLTIKTRGPCAFNRFLESLKQSSHGDLADILEGRKTTLFNNDEQRDINHTEITKDNNMKEQTYIETEEG